MFGADLCPGHPPVGSEWPEGSPEHCVIPGCKQGGPKKPEVPNSRRRSAFLEGGAPVTEPVPCLRPASLTAPFAALRTHNNYFVVLRCVDPGGKSEGTLVCGRDKLVRLVTLGRRGDRQAGGKLAAARGQE